MKKRIIILSCALIFLSCGSKKKSLEVHKEESREKKDLWQKKFDSLAKEIEFRNAILDLSIEPVDPKIPNKAKFTKTETGFEYEGENSKVGYKEEEKDSTVTENKSTESEMTDNGETYSSKKSKSMEKEKEPEFRINIWAVLFIVVVAFVIGKWKKWF